MFADRLRRLRERMAAAGVPALLVTDAAGCFYLSGLTGGEGTVVVTREAGYLLVDPRITCQAREEVGHLEIKEFRGSLYGALEQLAAGAGITSLAFEAANLSVQQADRLKEKLPGITCVPVPEILAELRQVKEPEEIERIRRAAAITDAAWDEIRPEIAPGLTEKEVAGWLEYALRCHGADGYAFPTIVASGPRAAMAHGTAGERRLRPGDLVVVDMGAVYQGYCADLTRTVVAGKPDARQREVYAAVKRSGETALALAAPGVKTDFLEQVAREVLKEYGLEEYFGHRLGHGVGISVHEGPSFSHEASVELVPGMVITIEPGVYIPDWGGVRIENLVLVTASGSEVLSRAVEGWGE